MSALRTPALGQWAVALRSFFRCLLLLFKHGDKSPYGGLRALALLWVAYMVAVKGCWGHWLTGTGWMP